MAGHGNGLSSRGFASTITAFFDMLNSGELGKPGDYPQAAADGSSSGRCGRTLLGVLGA